MRVKALEEGYYNHRRINEGAVFDIKSDKEFSKKWMVKVSEKVEVKASESKKAKAKARKPAEVI